MSAQLSLVENKEPLKLNLGCGQRPKEGFEGVDLHTNAKHRIDLWKFPFPWKNEEVDEIHCAHFVEHIPAREVEDRDVIGTGGEQYIGEDFLFAFFDECWRVLRPGGTMTVVVPSASSDGAHQDPTHRRFINHHTFSYLNAAKRKEFGLDHYRVSCDFEYNCIPVGPAEYAAFNEEVQRKYFHHYRNTVIEWHVTLTKKASTNG